ncbi:Putative Fis-like DNA-binding protein [Georgfuchsia toluolica]|uniref:Putative Fis-like DNA-binding protein n=1 Tax=Georgfuchsia toluolica TaxID=424218 RepID=A0A916J841_9PROT|nr:helix-turn-helix domain-containing protein [Georgfuchsia toluolica]CAG4884136.1 Putative Fis-like DNA-binding protein [Georgfuchsia toluolica]
MSNELHDCVKKTLNRYFRDLDGEAPHAVYDMVVSTVEKSMLEVVMGHADGNQTLAADILGINRNTLRRKLNDYRLL